MRMDKSRKKFEMFLGRVIRVWLLSLLFVAVGAIAAETAPFVYVTNSGNTVSVIDTATNTVVATVTVGIGPYGVAITPDGAFAYVALFPTAGPNPVSVIDTATNTVVATVMVGGSPNAVAITPNGASAYVTNTNSNTVSVIDTAINTVAATVMVQNGPWGVAITPL